MKITFTQDHQSVASGNEFYRAGTRADLRRGDELVAMGVAYAGWGDAPVDEETLANEPPTLNELGLSERVVERLAENGYDVAAINEATDDELMAIDGIGPATLEDIRNALATDA